MDVSKVDTVHVTNASGANTGTSFATMVDGDILILNSKNVNLTGTPTVVSAEGNDAIRLALGLGVDADGNQKIRSSDLIKGKNVKAWTKAAYAAPVQAFAYIGFNGTSGALSLADATEYRFRTVVTNARHSFLPHKQSGSDFYYITAATADNYAAASSIAAKINHASNQRGKVKFLADVLGSGAITEALTTVDTTVTKGSKTVSVVGVHGRSVGDLVVFRDVVYKVAVVNTTAIYTLDRAYSGPTETIDPDSTVDQVGTIAAGNYGIKITAKAIPANNLDLYSQVDFDISLAPINGSAGDEETVARTGAVRGSGYWEQVRDMEILASGHLGYTNKTQFPTDGFTPRAISTGTYRIYTIEYFDDVNLGVNVLRDVKQVMLAFDISGGTTKADALEAILDSWMASAGVAAVA